MVGVESSRGLLFVGRGGRELLDYLTVWNEAAGLIVAWLTDLYVLFLQTMNLLIRYFHELMVSLVGVKATVYFIV